MANGIPDYSDVDLARRFGDDDESNGTAPRSSWRRGNGKDHSVYDDPPPEPIRGIITWADITGIPKRKPLIKGLLDQGALSVVYGAANCGKTFFVLDMALHIALGWTWRGFQIKEPGPVLYIAAEGGIGIEPRLTAFATHHNVSPAGVDFLILPRPVDLCRSMDDAKWLGDQIRSRPYPQNHPCMLAIDTLSRVLNGGNENAPDDMGAFIAICDYLRAELQCHVLIVHHTGKDTDRGARGHSALRAACDTEIEVSREDGADTAVATVSKQRDMRGKDTFPFVLKSVELGQDEDGDTITSCVVEYTDYSPQKTNQKPLSPICKQALIQLHKAIEYGPVNIPESNHTPRGKVGSNKNLWRQYCQQSGIVSEKEGYRVQMNRIIVTLKDRGFIGVWDDFVWTVTTVTSP